MSKTWFFSDPHLHHDNILTFKTNTGELLRPFATIEEHDETLIANYNAIVRPEDRVYWMGDVTMHRRHIGMVGRFNGRKKLIKGNHDIFKLKDYLPFFEDIISYRIYPEHGIIFSHIPVHECQLEGRFKTNCHGHLHSNLVMKRTYKHVPDNRYINLCVEHTNWKPVDLNDILKQQQKD